MTIIRVILLVALTTAPVFASEATKMHERDYQVPWCREHGGFIEKSIEGGGVDCLLTDRAVEVEHAAEWQQSIGQARFYAVSSQRRPGVLLILEKPGDFRHLYKLLKAIHNDRFRWAVWVVWGWDQNISATSTERH